MTGALPMMFLLALACSGNTRPAIDLDAPFELAPGDAVNLPGDGEAVRNLNFIAVVGDSRCPVDVNCVWEGDAEIRLRIDGAEDSEERSLHTTVEPREIDLDGLVLRLLDLRPKPMEGIEIPQEDYVAVLALTTP